MNFHFAKVFPVLCLLFIISIFPSLGKAATFCVNDQADDGSATAGDCPDAACSGSSGPCSLRDAIAAANGSVDSDIITFSTSLISPLLISNTANL